MVWVYIVLGIIAYILMGGLAAWLIKLWSKEYQMSLWLGCFWPLTIPFILIVMMFMGVEWVANKLDSLFKKKPKNHD